jgi:hypothetical protein
VSSIMSTRTPTSSMATRTATPLLLLVVLGGAPTTELVAAFQSSIPAAARKNGAAVGRVISPKERTVLGLPAPSTIIDDRIDMGVLSRNDTNNTPLSTTFSSTATSFPSLEDLGRTIFLEHSTMMAEENANVAEEGFLDAVILNKEKDEKDPLVDCDTNGPRHVESVMPSIMDQNIMIEATTILPIPEQQVEDVTAVLELSAEAVDAATPPSAPTVGKILQFAIPAIGVWLCNPLLSMIDTAAVGLFAGTVQQAALNPAVAVTDYAALLIAFLYTGTTNLVATAWEQDQHKLPIGPPQHCWE